MENDSFQNAETDFNEVELEEKPVKPETESEEKNESKRESSVDGGDKTSVKMEDLDDGKIPEAYAGMPAEVLLHYSRRRPWQIGRLIGWLAVLTTFVTLITLSVIIIVESPPCLDFWEKSPIYQIYPRSFKDCSNKWREENGLKPRDICDDGIGDIPGIIEKLDYLKGYTDEDGNERGLGINIIWLSPVFASPMEDFGYDVSDYRMVEPLFGDLDDIEELIGKMHDSGMKLVLDFVPNHTSIQNKFFTESIANETLHDRYMWFDGEKPDGCDLEPAEKGDSTIMVPNRACDKCTSVDGDFNPSVPGVPDCPNNWQGVFAQGDDAYLPAWTYHPTVGKYYYHAFGWFQPDVNMRKQEVVDELNSVLDFWLDKGVDGFRVDAIGYAFEQADLRNEVSKDPELPGYWKNQHHDFTFEYGALHDLIMGFRRTLDRYSTEPGVDRFMVTESYSEGYDNVMRYYGNPWEREADFPFNFDLIWVGRDGFVDVPDLEEKIHNWMFQMPEEKVANWVVGNHDRLRLASRIPNLDEEGVKKVSKLFAQLIMALPGTNFIYNGEEIGMMGLTDEELPDGCKVDIQEDTRDVCRNPMQWTGDEATNYGFSGCDKSNHTNIPDTCQLEMCTWLPMSSSGVKFNVENELVDADSVLNFYQWMINFRKREEFTRGVYCSHEVSDGETVQKFLRYLDGGSVFEVIFNWGDKEVTYSTEGRNIITYHYGPTGLETAGKLSGYGKVILELAAVPSDYDLNKNCVQRRKVKKTSSNLILNM